MIVNAYALYWATGSRKRKGKTPTFPSGIVSKDLNVVAQYRGEPRNPSPRRNTLQRESQLYNPFARPMFEPKNPEPEVHISAGNPEPNQAASPFFDRFFWWARRKEGRTDMPDNVQVSVTISGMELIDSYAIDYCDYRTWIDGWYLRG